jgi:hypothetical protein
MDRGLVAYGTMFGPVRKLESKADKTELKHTFPD